MNFLAHLYLSGTSEELLIGNFIGDSVKGRDYNNYPKKVKEGILLHRKIDSFTDQHPQVAISKDRIRKDYHKYSPVIIDVYYDHFLALHWEKYHAKPLKEYVAEIYKLLDSNQHTFPQRTQYMVGFMITYNWLGNYQTIGGIKQALIGLGRRAKFASNMENAYKNLLHDYDELDHDFEVFFPELVSYVESLGYSITAANMG
jgi:acyl carrier protein phosphodiesterase